MFRNLIAGSLVLVTVGLLNPISAHADQSLTFNLGRFVVKPYEARTCRNFATGECDVLVSNLDFLDFDLGRFSGASVGADWLIELGDYLEAGVGIAYYRRTVPSVYLDFQHGNGAEIEQDLKLRVTPITASVRVLPLGRRTFIQPYVGGGIGVYNWRYSETGEFIDFSDCDRNGRNCAIFRDSYTATGTNVGPMAVFGLRLLASDTFGIGGEARYQRATGSLGSEFYGDRIDLGGMTYQVTFHVKFK